MILLDRQALLETLKLNCEMYLGWWKINLCSVTKHMNCHRYLRDSSTASLFKSDLVVQVGLGSLFFFLRYDRTKSAWIFSKVSVCFAVR